MLEFFFDKKKADELKKKWYSATSSFRLKIDERDFKDIILSPKENISPQEIQGMWQAYGQMRSTRITARAMVIATGVGGFGLWLFQQSLSQQKKELDEKEREIRQQKRELDEKEMELKATRASLDRKRNQIKDRLQLLDKAEKDALDAVSSANMFEGELLKADEYVKDICKGNSECLNRYNIFKEVGRNEGRKKFEEKMTLVKQNGNLEGPTLRMRQ